ncbi:hypothetical protein FRX31_020178, partial [Thalictrum thalictroides]
ESSNFTESYEEKEFTVYVNAGNNMHLKRAFQLDFHSSLQGSYSCRNLVKWRRSLFPFCIDSARACLAPEILWHLEPSTLKVTQYQYEMDIVSYVSLSLGKSSMLNPPHQSNHAKLERKEDFCGSVQSAVVVCTYKEEKR